MKVTITHMKAPWPAGAAVGDVVDVGAAVPGCFLGKCTPAGDDAEAAHTYEPVGLPSPPPVVFGQPAPVDQDELAIAKNMLAEAMREADELRGRLEQTEAAAVKANTERDAAVQRADAADAALAAAQAEAAAKPATKAKG